MGRIVDANKQREGEDVRQGLISGTCGELESTAAEDAVNVGGASVDLRRQARVGDGEKGNVDRTGANVPAAAESVGVIR